MKVNGFQDRRIRPLCQLSNTNGKRLLFIENGNECQKNLLLVSLIFLITTIPFWISFSTLASTGKSDILTLVRNLEYHRSYSPDFVIIKLCAAERTRTSTGLRPPAPQAGASTIPPLPHVATIERFELTFPFGRLLWRTPSSPSNRNPKFFPKCCPKP